MSKQNSNILQSSTMADYLVMEEREERMVSPIGTHVCRRKAHFLVPSVTSIDGPVAAPSQNCSIAPPAAKYKELHLKVKYSGWKNPSIDWKSWVYQLHSSHHSTWKRAGILNAIRNSTCIIHRYDDLIFGFVDKWCPTTNSFVFPWGEATITLEDVMVLGGFPVLGKSVLVPPQGREMEEKVKKLQKARSNISKSKAKKATQGKWITQFMGSESEIEHEALLAYWLSKFVFPFSRDSICSSIVSIAVHLAKGDKIALAPAVLACIYKSLTLLKAGVSAARKSGTMKDQNGVVEVIVPAPLSLVQVWIWERFPSLGPRPKSGEENGPRLARWHNVKSGSRYESMNIDSKGEDFQWRPYTRADSSGDLEMVYMDIERCAMVESSLDKDLEGWVRCLRTSELVSLEETCIEQYLPHRVAMQFGFDQDLPGHVERVKENHRIAWSNYTRPIRDVKLYVPSRLYKPCVTSRYLIWWKEMILGLVDSGDPDRDGKSLEEVKKDLLGRISEDDFFPQPPGFSLKRKRVGKAGASGNAEESEDQDFERQRALCSTVTNGGKNSSKGTKGHRKFVGSSSRERSGYNHSNRSGFAQASHPRTCTSSASSENETDQSEDEAQWTSHCDNSEEDARGRQFDENGHHLSSTENNGNNIEEMVSIEPVEEEGEAQTRSSRIGLEKRICIIETLVVYLQERKFSI